VNIKKQNQFPFLIGAFISSLGSQTFMISLIAFMKAANYTLWQIGLIIGSMQFANMIINLLLGDTADRISPRKLVLWTEISAAITAGLLAWTWTKGPAYFDYFLILAVLRASVLAVQGPGKNKIAKLLSDGSYSSNSRLAVWMNKVNYGTIFFAAGFAWLAVSFLQFPPIIMFDATTFLINGIIIWRYLKVPLTTFANSRFRFIDKFVYFYKYCQKTAFFDLFLTISLCGGNVFIVRFIGSEELWIPIFLASYGLAIWTTGYLQRIKWVQQQHTLFWTGLAVSFFLLSKYPEQGMSTLLCFMLNNHFYWLLYHKYSAQIQAATPAEHMAAVSSARTVQMLLIIAIGEFRECPEFCVTGS
jgi:MFS family permease